MDGGKDADAPAGLTTLIARPNFRRVWLAGGLGWLLRWLEMLAIGVFVFRETGSPGVVALVTAVRFLPMLLISAGMGAVAERFDRRRIMLLSYAMMTLNTGILALLAASGVLELWHLGLCAFIGGLHATTEFPVRRAMVGEIAGAPNTARAMTLDTMTHHVMRIVGPALGGLLLKDYGLAAVYVTASAGYLLAFSLIWRTDYRSGRRGGGLGLFREIGEGLRYVRGERRIVGALAITAIANVFGFPYFSMVPVIGADVLSLDAFHTGTLQSADAVGALIGAMVLARLARPRWFGWIFIGGTLALLVAVALLSLARLYEMALLALFLAGIGMAGFAAMQSTIAFATAPPEMRSRAMSLVAICIGMAPLGILHVGLLAQWLGAPTALMVMALEGMLALALSAWFWPELRQSYEARPVPSAPR